ncbi:MAG TPA: hypothetical protein VNM90_24685 [Haliangium sp.]|nr:hypothetical protein [Haliangium sp.]
MRAPHGRQRWATRLASAALAAALAVLLGSALAPAAPRSQAVMVPVEHGGAIDWTRGLAIATGAAPGDIRAPSPDLARVGAERRARAQAHERLLAAARALRVVSGAGDGPVGERADADAAVARRLASAVARSLDLAVDYGSDGSVVLTAGLPLEAVRQAVHPVAAVDATALGAAVQPAQVPTALIVDARDVLDAPVLGLGLVAGAHEYAGPAVFHGSVGAAATDARRGSRAVRTRATAVRDGRLVVDLAAEDLAAANAARALVIVIIGRS